MIDPSKGRDTLVPSLQFCDAGCHSDERFVLFLIIVRCFARQISGSVLTKRGSIYLHDSTKPKQRDQAPNRETKIKRGKREMNKR